MKSSEAGGGLFASLRQLTGTAVAIVQVRLELFGSELEQEKLRLFGALQLAAIGLLVLALALVLGVGFVLMLFWEGYRLAATGVLALLLAGLGVALLQAARSRLQASEGGPFALSRAELRRDLEALGVPKE